MKCIYYRIQIICLLAGFLLYAGALTAQQRFSPEEMKTFPLTGFFDTPAGFLSNGKPGDLIRSESFDDYKIPPGAEAVRILYGTEDSKGNLAVSSGAVLIPAGKAPEGGWPVIAWAHGTSGVNRKCSISLTALGFAMYRLPLMHLKNGYAIVATDYAGLGSDSPVAYMDRIGNAWDVINSVKAAQKAVPSLGDKWVALGHSSGAHTMGGVAQIEADLDDSSYLGFVSVSGLGNARDPMVNISRNDPALGIFILLSIKAHNPAFNYEEVLTDKGLSLVDEVADRCQGPGFGRPKPSPIKGGEAFKKDWDRHPVVQAYFDMSESANAEYKGPGLVLIGDDETPWTMRNDPEMAERMCRQQQDIQLSVIPGANHFTLLHKSVQVQSKWIADRFAGKAAVSNCKAILK